MLYYSYEARKSAIEEIKHCIEQVSKVSGKELSYLDASATIKYLNMLINEIEKEGKEKKSKADWYFK